MKLLALVIDSLICANFSANESKNFRQLTFDPVTSLYIICEFIPAMSRMLQKTYTIDKNLYICT